MMNSTVNHFRSILCLNGNLPSRNFFDKHSDLPIIAADGAGCQLIDIGIQPSVVVGDMDSFALNISDYSDIDFIRCSNQNYNDFEKSILFLKEKKLLPSLVCGVFGGEADHVINNINCLMKYGQEHPMVFYDEEILEKPKWGFPLSDSFSFSGVKGEIISIIPHPTVTLSTKGLKWDLKNKDLSTLGISSFRNKEQSHNIEINVHRGRVLIIANRYLEFYK
jgi:thiamine pyrophosphokinase